MGASQLVKALADRTGKRAMAPPFEDRLPGSQYCPGSPQPLRPRLSPASCARPSALEERFVAPDLRGDPLARQTRGVRDLAPRIRREDQHPDHGAASSGVKVGSGGAWWGPDTAIPEQIRSSGRHPRGVIWTPIPDLRRADGRYADGDHGPAQHLKMLPADRSSSDW